MISIVLFVIGVIFFGRGFFCEPNGAIQQVVQWLMYVCGSIFVVGGLLYSELRDIAKK